MPYSYKDTLLDVAALYQLIAYNSNDLNYSDVAAVLTMIADDGRLKPYTKELLAHAEARLPGNAGTGTDTWAWVKHGLKHPGIYKGFRDALPEARAAYEARHKEEWDAYMDSFGMLKGKAS